MLLQLPNIIGKYSAIPPQPNVCKSENQFTILQALGSSAQRVSMEQHTFCCHIRLGFIIFNQLNGLFAGVVWVQDFIETGISLLFVQEFDKLLCGHVWFLLRSPEMKK